MAAYDYFSTPVLGAGLYADYGFHSNRRYIQKHHVVFRAVFECCHIVSVSAIFTAIYVIVLPTNFEMNEFNKFAATSTITDLNNNLSKRIARL